MLGKGLPAAFVPTDKGFFSGMNPHVCLQDVTLPESPSTARVRADKGFFAAVDSLVHSQVAGTGKGFSTALV